MKRVLSIILAFLFVMCSISALADAEKWKCPKCGNAATGKFCSKCGTKRPADAEIITPTPEPTPTAEPTPTPTPTNTPEFTPEPDPTAASTESIELEEVVPEASYDVKLPHFRVQLSGRWLKSDGDKKVSFYAKRVGSFDGGFFRVVEFDEDHSSTQNDTRRKMYYDSYVEALVSSYDIDGITEREEIQVDDTLTVLFDTDQKQDDGTVARVYYALSFVHAGNGFLAMYSNTSVSNDEAKAEFKELLKCITFRFEKVMQRAFNNDIIHLTGYEVDEAKKTITIEFWWHNGQKSANAFATTFSIEAYQNKVQLNPGSTYGIEDNQWTKIQYGGDLVCYEVFQLRDLSSPVTLIVDKIFDFTNQYKDSEYSLDLSR